MMTLPLKSGVEGVLGAAGDYGGYYWQPVDVVHSYAGVNEYTGAVPMPSVPPGGPYVAARVLIETSGAYTYSGETTASNWDVLRLAPIIVVIIRAGRGGTSSATWAAVRQMHDLYAPYTQLRIWVERPRDGFGNLVGTLQWNFTTKVVGVVYLRNAVRDYQYSRIP